MSEGGTSSAGAASTPPDTDAVLSSGTGPDDAGAALDTDDASGSGATPRVNLVAADVAVAPLAETVMAYRWSLLSSETKGREADGGSGAAAASAGAGAAAGPTDGAAAVAGDAQSAPGSAAPATRTEVPAEPDLTANVVRELEGLFNDATVDRGNALVVAFEHLIRCRRPSDESQGRSKPAVDKMLEHAGVARALTDLENLLCRGSSDGLFTNHDAAIALSLRVVGHGTNEEWDSSGPFSDIVEHGDETLAVRAAACAALMMGGVVALADPEVVDVYTWYGSLLATTLSDIRGLVKSWVRRFFKFTAAAADSAVGSAATGAAASHAGGAAAADTEPSDLLSADGALEAALAFAKVLTVSWDSGMSTGYMGGEVELEWNYDYGFRTMEAAPRSPDDTDVDEWTDQVVSLLVSVVRADSGAPEERIILSARALGILCDNSDWDHSGGQLEEYVSACVLHAMWTHDAVEALLGRMRDADTASPQLVVCVADALARAAKLADGEIDSAMVSDIPLLVRVGHTGPDAAKRYVANVLAALALPSIQYDSNPETAAERAYARNAFPQTESEYEEYVQIPYSVSGYSDEVARDGGLRLLEDLAVAGPASAREAAIQGLQHYPEGVDSRTRSDDEIRTAVEEALVATATTLLATTSQTELAERVLELEQLLSAAEPCKALLQSNIVPSVVNKLLDSPASARSSDLLWTLLLPEPHYWVAEAAPVAAAVRVVAEFASWVGPGTTGTVSWEFCGQELAAQRLAGIAAAESGDTLVRNSGVVTAIVESLRAAARSPTPGVREIEAEYWQAQLDLVRTLVEHSPDVSHTVRQLADAVPHLPRLGASGHALVGVLCNDTSTGQPLLREAGAVQQLPWNSLGVKDVVTVLKDILGDGGVAFMRHELGGDAAIAGATGSRVLGARWRRVESKTIASYDSSFLNRSAVTRSEVRGGLQAAQLRDMLHVLGGHLLAASTDGHSLLWHLVTSQLDHQLEACSIAVRAAVGGPLGDLAAQDVGRAIVASAQSPQSVRFWEASSPGGAQATTPRTSLLTRDVELGLFGAGAQSGDRPDVAGQASAWFNQAGTLPKMAGNASAAPATARIDTRAGAVAAALRTAVLRLLHPGIVELRLHNCSAWLDDGFISEAMTKCPNLHALVLADSAVAPEALDAVMAACPRLRSLSVRGATGLQRLPVSLRRLDKLDVAACPLSELPPESSKPGPTDEQRSMRVLRYLKTKGDEACDIIKLALVGFAFEGKSTVADLLCVDADSSSGTGAGAASGGGSEARQTRGRSALDRTVGIDIRTFSLSGRVGTTPLKCCVFDFAGQVRCYRGCA